MSMRCISSGITCCLDLHLALVACASGAFCGRAFGQRIVRGGSGADRSAAAGGRRGGGALGAHRARRSSRSSWRCSVSVGLAALAAPPARRAPRWRVSASCSGLACARPSARAPGAAARSRPSAASTANRGGGRCRPASNPSSMARLLPSRAGAEEAAACLGLLGDAGELDAEPVQVGDHPVLRVGGRPAAGPSASTWSSPCGSCAKTQRSFASMPASNSLTVTSGLAGDLVGDDVHLGLAVADAQQLHQPVGVAQRLQRQLGDDDDVVEAARTAPARA